MKHYEITFIEPSDLAHYWVISFKINDGEIGKEIVEALDRMRLLSNFAIR